MEKYFSFSLLSAGVFCGIFVAVSGPYDATEEMRGLMIKIFHEFNIGVQKLPKDHFQIKFDEKLEHHALHTNYMDFKLNKTDDDKPTGIRCHVNDSLQIELILPNYKFSCDIDGYWGAITVSNLRAVLDVNDYKKLKINFVPVFQENERKKTKNPCHIHDKGDLRKLITSAFYDETASKLKYKVINFDGRPKSLSKSLKEICMPPLNFFSIKRKNRNDDLVYQVVNPKGEVNVKKTSLLDLEIKSIDVLKFWDFAITMNHFVSSNTTELILRANNLQGNITWKYTVHSTESNKSFEHRSLFRVEKLEIRVELVGAQRSNGCNVHPTNVTFPDLGEGVFSAILLLQTREIIKKSFISIIEKTFEMHNILKVGTS